MLNDMKKGRKGDRDEGRKERWTGERIGAEEKGRINEKRNERKEIKDYVKERRKTKYRNERRKLKIETRGGGRKRRKEKKKRRKKENK